MLDSHLRANFRCLCTRRLKPVNETTEWLQNIPALSFSVNVQTPIILSRLSTLLSETLSTSVVVYLVGFIENGEGSQLSGQVEPKGISDLRTFHDKSALWKSVWTNEFTSCCRVFFSSVRGFSINLLIPITVIWRCQTQRVFKSSVIAVILYLRWN